MEILTDNLDELDNVNQQEYIVTLTSMDDLESFYNDIENPGGPEYIPDRAVDVFRRRPTSTNTHYMLTIREAAMLQRDPRVISVAPAEFIRSSIKLHSYNQFGVFSKAAVESFGGPTLDARWKNWALLRCLEGVQRTGWGDNGTLTQTGNITVKPTGKNVDVIICDGISGVPNHPEYAVNADGTGGSRYVQYDWHQLNSIAAGLDDDSATLLTGAYSYAAAADLGNANHGSHTTGTACGNTQGWARDANIYQIDPVSGTVDALIMWDYIRAFHKSKSVNTATGRKNPTIVNCSFGSTIGFPVNDLLTGIIQANRRGAAIGNYTANVALTSTQLTSAGIYNTGDAAHPRAAVPVYYPSDAADITQAIADGIIIVGSAGNDSFFIDATTGPDYNNTYVFKYSQDGGNTWTPFQYSQHRGTAPAAVPGVISVGAVGADSAEHKGFYSNTGPGVDVFAPGTWIISALHDVNGGWAGSSTAADSRNGSYYIGREIGTSMASPQVTGMLACVLELYPNMTPAQAYDYIVYYSKQGQLADTGGASPSWTSDQYSLQGATNRYMFLPKERPDTGTPYPKKNVWLRPTSGRTYPRVRSRIRG
jgi:hypothetical protein